LIEEHGKLVMQRHAMCCLWMMNQGKVHVPPAWSTASLKGEWSAPCQANGWRRCCMSALMKARSLSLFEGFAKARKRLYDRAPEALLPGLFCLANAERQGVGHRHPPKR
jgi:hypothetical protein